MIIPNKSLDIVDKVVMKCMDVLELLTSFFSEDLTIEDLKKSEISNKTIRKDIFYGLVVYDPVRFTGINKIQCGSANLRWN